MVFLPDPAASLPLPDQANAALVKAARLQAWKRPATKTARVKERGERIARWEEATGMTWLF